MNFLLFGNPNCGKSTLFNLLTGLRQKIGNFPGVTVDKQTGTVPMNGATLYLTDFPGVYSIYPKSTEEQIVYEALKELNSQDQPAVGLVVVDASNLERGLFLFSQLADLKIPLVLIVNMIDLAERNGIAIDEAVLKKELPSTPVVLMNARVGLGKHRLLDALEQQMTAQSVEDYFSINENLLDAGDFAQQEKDALLRCVKAKELCHKVVQQKKVPNSKRRIDRWLTHPMLGYIVFSLVLIAIFQAVFTLAAIPMDYLEQGLQWVSQQVGNTLPEGAVQELICGGIIPGITGVVVFIPQIALLFFFIALLEDSGYLARAVFLMDRLVRPFGMNGRSVVPLLSSMACAIPGIMATRGIPNSKERLITLFVAPLMSCSARIPVYTLLISVVIPTKHLLGVFQLQGLVLFALYALGIISALAVAWVMHRLLKQDQRSVYLMEIPDFKPPHWRNIFTTIFDKIKVFVLEAGGIIFALSIVIWALSNYGPDKERKKALVSLQNENRYLKSGDQERERLEAAALLEHSYLGKFGKVLEPAIAPLGYDWKIGIAIGSSFLAREVFVGTLSTLYAHDEAAGYFSLREKLKNETHPDGTKKFTLASGISLMVFYVFALQCLSTLAVSRRETGSWKIPIFQLVLYGSFAYGAAFCCYRMF
jgi:ferrous iron transport protein B